jgi:hypothetical protein
VNHEWQRRLSETLDDRPVWECSRCGAKAVSGDAPPDDVKLYAGKGWSRIISSCDEVIVWTVQDS